MTSWKWGNLKENYNYDDEGHLKEIILGNFLTLKMEYSSGKLHDYPNQVNNYQLQHDRHGGLLQIITPLGFNHTFLTIPLINFIMIKYLPPWKMEKNPFVYILPGNGRVNNEHTEIKKDHFENCEIHYPDNAKVEFCNKNEIKISSKSDSRIFHYSSGKKIPKKSNFK